MSWHHRVIRHDLKDGHVPYYGIHEVYCDENGKIWACTEKAKITAWEATEEENLPALRQELKWMLEALDAPILDIENIPEEGAESPSMDEEE